jgi:hypothetical protein
MKVLEPKTPYINYDHSTDIATTEGVAPFELEQAMGRTKGTGTHSANASDYGNDWSDEDEKLEVDEEEQRKHEKFLEARKKHYTMKASDPCDVLSTKFKDL